MNSINLILGFLSIGYGFLFMGISIPLLRGSFPRNSLYGFRFRQSFESEEAWQRINRYGARRMILWSLVILVLGLGTFFLPLGESVILIVIVAVVPPMVILIPVIEAYRYAQRQGRDSSVR